MEDEGGLPLAGGSSPGQEGITSL